jgi:glycosyltransferase involved in cell wall biosynthesis
MTPAVEIGTRRILIINHYAGSSRHGMEFRPFELAREWQQMGNEVLIVAGSPSHLRVHEPELHRLVTRERVDGVRFEWLRLPRYQGNGVRRAANIVAFATLVRLRSRHLARRFRPDVVIASSTHPLDICAARAIAKQAGARLVFEVHDIWPLTPIELGGVSARHPFMKLLSRAEHYACTHADNVVSVLPDADHHLSTRGMRQSRYVHIPNGIAVARADDQREPLPEAHAALIRGLRAQGHFLVGYTGGIGLANAMDDLLAAAAQLRNEPISFLLWGDGPHRHELEQRAGANALANVHFLGTIPRAVVRSALDACDVLYLGWKDRSIYRFGMSPNKLFDYLAAERPILHATSAPGDPVAAYGSGLSVPAEDIAAIAEAIRAFAAMPQHVRDGYAARGREAVLEHHDYPVLARRFLQVALGVA